MIGCTKNESRKINTVILVYFLKDSDNPEKKKKFANGNRNYRDSNGDDNMTELPLLNA